MIILAKYNTALTLRFPLVKAGSMNLAVSGDYTHASGDVRISKDGGAAATATNAPSTVAMGGNGSVLLYTLDLTSTEMSAAEIVVVISDAATKAIEDQTFVIHTYGNASARHPFDLSSATVTPGANTITSSVIATDAIGSAQIAASAIGSSEIANDAITAAKIADGAIDAATFAAGAINAAAIADGAIDAATFAASAIDATAIASNAITSAKIATGAITASTFAAGAIDASAIAADAIGSSELAASAVTEIQTGLSTLTAGQVNAEVVDALSTDTYAEPGSVPAATASLKDKVGWLFALARNKVTQTSSVTTLRNDADSGDIATAGVSDDGSTFTRAEFV